MGKVTSINKGRFLGSYSDAQKSERIPDAVYFVTGVMLSIVLPQMIYSVYGGFVPLIAFVSSTLTGFFLGLVVYRLSPERRISCVATATVPQAPSGEPGMPKAA
jgi:hypothetical protein